MLCYKTWDRLKTERYPADIDQLGAAARKLTPIAAMGTQLQKGKELALMQGLLSAAQVSGAALITSSAMTSRRPPRAPRPPAAAAERGARSA